DKLLVGTKQGSLLYYSVEPSADKDCKHNVQLLRYVKNFSKKPIQQMAVLADQELAIRLSDGILTLHDLVNPNFSLIKTLNKTKGASLFTLDIQKHVSQTGGVTSFVRLCVSVKKKLQTYYLKNRDFLDLGEDITVPDVPRVLSWEKESICVGCKGGYYMAHNITDDSEEEKKRNVHQIQTLFAFDLFHSKQFGRSMVQFLKLGTDPYEVIKLFPELVSRDSEAVSKLSDQDMENGSEYIELILRYAGWVLESHPEDGIKIFTEEIPEVESLPRPKVLDYLLRIDNHTLIIPYIEHAIHIWKESSPTFHNALIHQYRERILANGLNDPSSQFLRKKLRDFLETSKHYQTPAILKRFPTDCLPRNAPSAAPSSGFHNRRFCSAGDSRRRSRPPDYVDRLARSPSGQDPHNGSSGSPAQRRPAVQTQVLLVSRSQRGHQGEEEFPAAQGTVERSAPT
ncbi:unnamed protein product, partial [Nesidiocoris tenuis]